MKYIIVLADGLADLPVPELGGLTPLEAAHMPNTTKLVTLSKTGQVRTVPAGMEPGSDVANLSVLGYDPAVYYKGRSGIEAASLGIVLADNDLAIRTNLVTISEKNSLMTDHGADEISSEEAYQLIDAINQHPDMKLGNIFKGVSYRHLLVLHDAVNDLLLTPPHDIIGEKIGDFLPKGSVSTSLIEAIKLSQKILKTHPVNIKRSANGKNPANSLWFWGAGTSTKLPAFHDKTGLYGGVVSAVDLVKGLGCLSDMKVIEVPGATGTLHTNLTGKLNASIAAIEAGLDLVYLHIEAPDECGHKGNVRHKILAAELIDEKIIGPLSTYADNNKTLKIMMLPDHPTPVTLRTHTADPVPFLIYDPRSPYTGPERYTEKNAVKTGIILEKGHELMEYFIKD